MRAANDSYFPAHSRSLIIGVLNIMPSVDRVPTENMFRRRFENFPLPVEIVWLHPDAHRADFAHGGEHYQLPNADIFNRIDYLFRTGADVEFVAEKDNRFLECVRQSRAFNKGSTSLCWSAGQIYADATDQLFSSFLMGEDEDGRKIKRAGYFDYRITSQIDHYNEDRAWMACSRHFRIDAQEQLEKARYSGFTPFAVSSDGYDVAGLKQGNDILLFTHNEYDPARLHYETERCIGRANSEAEKESLRAKFPHLRTYEQEADLSGQKLFHAILTSAAERKYAAAPAPVRHVIHSFA